MSIVLKAEGIAKKYTISHLGPDSQRNFREQIVYKINNTFRRLIGQKRKIVKETFWALKDINFDIHAGERIGIVGMNGAGKSTVLKLLSRITEPTTGVIKIRGRVACLLEIGTGFHPELTGRENIFLNGAILGMKRVEIQKKFDEIVAFSGVENFLDIPVKRYSSGMHVRLAFAIAAHLDSEILILDEVLAVGDAAFREKCLGKMQDISRGDGRTIIFVSHNMSAVKNLCTSGIFLSKGMIRATGEIDHIINAYFNYRSTGTGQLIWKNDPMPTSFSGDVYIHGYQILDSCGKIADQVLDNSKKYFLIIDSDIIREDDNLSYFFAIYTDDEQLLFLSDIHDSIDAKEEKLNKGHVILKVPIPVHLLMRNHYRIEVSCVIHYKEWILPPRGEHRLSFYVNSGELNSMGYDEANHPFNSSKRPGFLASSQEWGIEYI